MANTCQLECEGWVRLRWLPERFGQPFRCKALRLTAGGVFTFDAVSADGTIAASISTSGASTASGKRGAGKLYKLRSDMFFLLMANVSQRLVVLTEPDMYNLCRREQEAGRVPSSIEFVHAPLPPDLCERLKSARGKSSAEVSPSRSGGNDDDLSLRARIREATPSNESLLKLAESHPPPTSWWEEEVDPFKAEEGE
jgi:hypothetical protein